MKYRRKPYEEQDFLRIRDFLKYSLKEIPYRKNWLIDRWNFCRYWAHIMSGTFKTWPATVGLWEDDRGEIAAVVNSEGNCKGNNVGEAFFQLGNRVFTDEFLNELVEYAEKELSYKTSEGLIINLRVNEDDYQLKEILKNRDYVLIQGKDPLSGMSITSDLKVELPEGFRLVDANEVNDFQKGFAHGRAFGYYKNDVPDDDDAERCYKSLRKAPDYIPELDLAVLDSNGEIASFATVWYDDLSKAGILEPVGTVPKYRRMGLGKAVIYEGVNRVRSRGAVKMYVGSDQPFYLSIGFSAEYAKEIWHKRLI